MKVIKNWVCIILYLGTAMILTNGCSTLDSTLRTTEEKTLSIPKEADLTASNETPTDFILGTGDTIQISVYRKKTPESTIGVGDTISVNVYRSSMSEFKIGYGDTVKVSVYRHSEFDREAKIDQLGIISFPLIGDVKATGKDEVELKKEIEQKLLKYLSNPQVTIDVGTKQSLLIEELSMDFKILAQKRGKIGFPLIGEVQADGRDVVEFKEELEQRLSDHLVNPQVSVDLTPLASLQLDDFSLEETIDSTGKIMFPLLGDMQVSGKGVYALRDEISEKLSEYLVEPQVTVKITGVASQKYYVLGEVENPGTFALSQQTSIWEAVTKSGWFTDDANPKRVILAQNKEKEVHFRFFNFQEMLGLTIQDHYMQNGDVIYVPPSIIADVEDFMLRFSNIISPLLDVQRSVILWPDMIDAIENNEEGSGNVIVSP